MTYPDNIRAAFREVALGLMEWQDPPLMGRREYARLERIEGPTTYHPWCAQDDVEPYNLDASDEEGWSK